MMSSPCVKAEAFPYRLKQMNRLQERISKHLRKSFKSLIIPDYLVSAYRVSGGKKFVWFGGLLRFEVRGGMKLTSLLHRKGEVFVMHVIMPGMTVQQES